MIIRKNKEEYESNKKIKDKIYYYLSLTNSKLEIALDDN